MAIYRLSRQIWQTELEGRIGRREQEFTELYWPFTEQRPPTAEGQAQFRRTANAWARGVERVYGGWTYNEVVGWVHLYWNGPGPVVKGYLWQVGHKSVDSRPRRRFQRGFIPFPFIYGEAANNKVLEEWFNETQTDSAIYEQLRDALMQIVGSDGELPGRHLDLSIFDVVAPKIRWRDVLFAGG